MGQAETHHSARLVRMIGASLALVFGIGLVAVIVTDHERRVEATRVQNQGFADEGQRLLEAQLRNLERAMDGIAEDSSDLRASVPDRADALIAENIAGVASRQEELADLMLVTAGGTAITPGEGDPDLSRWFDAGGQAHLRFGPLQRRHGQWVLPIAVPTMDGNRVLARLRQSQLQDVVEHLRSGRDAVAAVTDRYGTIIARTGNSPGVIGQSVDALFKPFDTRDDRRVSRIDGVDRMIAVSGPERYPLWVGVGVASASVLGPWYRFTVFSALLYVLYCIGFAYLYRHLLISGRAQRAYVADLTAASERLADAEKRFRLAFDKNPIPVWVYDMTTLAFLEVNEAAVQAYGYSRDEFLSMRITDIRDARDALEVKKVVAAVRRGEEGEPARVWVHRRKDGSTLDVRLHAANIDFSGHQGRLVLAEDITERLHAERALTYRATHDVITGLPNTEAMVDYLDHGLGKGTWYEVVYVHLRGIDRASDTFGLEVGRSVLRTVASRFRRLGANMVAHRPGERFLVAIGDPSRHDAIMAALLGAVNEPVAVNDALHALDPQIGIATHPADGPDAGQVIANAALAAHVEGEQQGRLQVFERGMARRSIERITMASRIRQAIERHELTMHYQPVVDARSAAICALEALIRWPQANGSFISPDEFIPLCEETGLVVPLGHWAFEAAARDHVRLAQAGHGDISIAVNVSAVQFRRTDVAAQVRATTEAHGLPLHALQLELTESSLMEPAYAVTALRKLNEQGTRVSLDDFGTGFSSMAYLRDLPIDALKIDRSFVAAIDTDERAASICRSIVALAHTLDMTAVAEGVEREGQYRWLRDNGCDRIQGYFVHAAMPLPTLLDYLAARGQGHPSPRAV